VAGDDRRTELPPEDQPDVFWIGPVGPIPIGYEDDPGTKRRRAAWSVARKKAQALHSAEELLNGMRDPDWRVRHESIDRVLSGLDDSSEEVRWSARYGLDQLGLTP
jgi:hypothetical protein